MNYMGEEIGTIPLKGKEEMKIDRLHRLKNDLEDLLSDEEDKNSESFQQIKNTLALVTSRLMK